MLTTDGAHEWTVGIGGTSYDFGNVVTSHPDGGVLLRETFRDTVDFDPSAGAFAVTSVGYNDLFITHFSAGGTHIWTRTWRSLGELTLDDVDTDETGIHLTGSFEGSLDADPGAGETILTSSGGVDAFLIKLDDAGVFLWAVNFGGPSTDRSKSLLGTPTGLYITGVFSGTADFDPSAEIDLGVSRGDWDVFLVKLSDDGEYMGKSLFGSASGEGDIGNAIVLGPSETLFVIGRFFQSVDFGGISRTSHGDSDAFIGKYTQN